MRTEYTLTKAEFDELKALKDPQPMWDFWQRIAKQLNIDPKSIMGSDKIRKFTALPVDHKCHWCAPMPLKCKPYVWRDEKPYYVR